MEQENEFEDSVQATETIEDLHMLINDPRIANWLHTTDTNYGTSKLGPRFDQIRQQLTELLDEFFEAE